jgi:hypothetical protein
MTPVIELGSTIPYDGPDWAMEWIGTAQKAFDEYWAYKSDKDKAAEDAVADKFPNVNAFIEKYASSGYSYFDYTDNGDGTCTLMKYRTVEDSEHLEPNLWGEMVPSHRDEAVPETATVVSTEEIQAYEEYMMSLSFQEYYGNYHYIYDVRDAEDAAKLEEIAAKYNLVLRDGEVTQFAEDKDDAQLNQQLSTAVGKDSIYREAPEFDHFSYFDSGSFQSAADIPLQDGRKAFTYICNTAYNEMVSGDEVGGFTVREDEPLITRSYTAADGTELTISQNSTQAIIYAFLDESYITVQVEIDNWRSAPTDGLDGVTETNFDLSEDVVNYVADFINYSNIGK